MPSPASTFRVPQERPVYVHSGGRTRQGTAREDPYQSSWSVFVGRQGADQSALGAGGLRAQFSTRGDRKSTRLNSSHLGISYAVFCLKKKKHDISTRPSNLACVPADEALSGVPSV